MGKIINGWSLRTVDSLAIHHHNALRFVMLFCHDVWSLTFGLQFVVDITWLHYDLFSANHNYYWIFWWGNKRTPTVAQNAISPFPSFIRFSRCFCSPHGTIQRMLGSYSLTISIRLHHVCASHTIMSRFAQLFRFPNNILARHMVDSYSLGEFPRLSLFQRSVCYRDSLTISAMRTP